jgi:uncharacterized protein involved in cysteine biosynthesis
MLNDLSKAIAQLRDPKLLKILLMSLAMAVLVMGLLIFGVIYVIGGWDVNTGGLFGISFLDIALQWLVDTAGVALAVVIALMLFPAAAIGLQSLFLDSVAEAVEKKHYPRLPPARKQRMTEIVGTALKLMAIVLGLNILLLFVWVLLLIIATPLAPIPYYLVNGYLLGREYFELLALRRMDPLQAAVLRKQKLGGNMMDGIILTLLFTIPIVNLVGPMVAAAYMTHRFHRVWRPGMTPPSMHPGQNPSNAPRITDGDALM